MHRAALFHDHGHDCVLVRLPPFFVYPDDLVDPDITDQITHDENEVRRDNTMGVDVSHGVSG